MAHDVFISYSSADKTVADAVCATLESRKIRCWIAPRDVLPGVSYAESLIDALNRSRIVVLVFSTNSNNSQQVLREIERAVNKGLPIIPVRIEDVSPTKSMEYFLSVPHWLDALTPPLERHLQKLADTIETLLTSEPESHQPAKPEPVNKKAKRVQSPLKAGDAARTNGGDEKRMPLITDTMEILLVKESASKAQPSAEAETHEPAPAAVPLPEGSEEKSEQLTGEVTVGSETVALITQQGPPATGKRRFARPVIVALAALLIVSAGVFLVLNSPGGRTNQLLISSLTAATDTAAPGQSVKVECVVADDAQSQGTIQWTADGGSFVKPSGSIAEWVAPDKSGTYNITATVSGPGVTTQQTIQLSVTDLVIDSIAVTPDRLGPKGNASVECRLSGVASAPGATVNYGWSTDGGDILGFGGKVTYVAPLQTGKYHITLTVTDSTGGQSTRSVEVTVN